MTDDEYQAKLDRLADALADAVELTQEILAEKARRDAGGKNVVPLFPGPGEGGNSA